MTFTAPLGLLALLAIPTIVVIHLFRRRFPHRRVAGLFLWQVAARTPEGGGRLAKLPITASLILECLAALALALIIAGARLSSASATAHLVVLLDDSASMAAVDTRGESARDRAVRRVHAEMERLGSAARVTLIASGDRPSVMAGPAAYQLEARTALAAWKPAAPNHSLALGLRLARELAGSSGQVMIVSDLPAVPRGEPQPEAALWASVGVPLNNVGIIAAERSIAANGTGSISLTLANDSDAAARRRLDVIAGNASVASRDVDLPKGVSSLSLSIPPGLPAVRVTLEADALLRDNDVTLVEPRPRVVGVANHLREGRGREALIKAVGALAGVTAADPAHLTFEDAPSLDRAPSPGTWRVGIGKPPARWTAAGEPRDFIGPFVLEKRHPLLLGITLDGVVWTGAIPTTDAVHPIVSTGDRALIGLAASGATAVGSDVILNLDLDRTNLIRSPDWPILISNLVELRRQNLPGPERWNYRLGEWVRVQLGRAPTGTLRFRCGGVERTLPATSDLEFQAPAPGGLLQILEGEQVLFELGVNFFDESETNLRLQASGDAGALNDVSRLRGDSGPSSDPLFWTLLAVATAAILANWFALAPRRSRA